MFLGFLLFRIIGFEFNLFHNAQINDSSQNNTNFNENISPKNQILDSSNENSNQPLKANVENFIPYENTDIYPPNPYTPYPTYCTPAQLQKRQKLPRPKYVIGGVVAATIADQNVE
ncbi:hypothetical protein TVAG_202460 [Trichomonas vaginalis G3]|uniref:Uncharacterized protein n=1 Tax=Trichomonas vaginalis (strain ATCC PRA-98 / G3) TaxID=412133 RepID=A2G2F1_TRIV3|nr:hypothetical protein TVAGG3_0423320 [Trichomonas vaginalis G3]EAX88669.1 hypothetical protein TVAG_202460 [Trichomonas vaginalis G3]KAI5536221.1 hypothetical protein TVAGG3_0423320 [Trichomonas vaginalis G3]|eukprot:XP_001301599.1 hypothetical protein [Trichomonas vaginalis G3]